MEESNNSSANDNYKKQPLLTTDRFLQIFRNDPHFSNVRLDTMRMTACRVMPDGKRVYWSDVDDAETRLYIEQRYNLRNVGKCNDAFLLFLSERHFSPVQDAIRAITWDGKPRCEGFFARWLGAADSPYSREVSRIFFAQAIRRAFDPGCKADFVVVLKGAQGSGKSTLCRWLALEDQLFSSIETIDGQRGYEAIQGKFICELEVLLATIGEGTKKEAAVKAFITRQNDFYRRPYDRRSSDNLRSCVFVGTTNKMKFLSDQTGNRRWFPLDCHGDGQFIFDHEFEIKADIRQCYAEMLAAFLQRSPLASPIANRVLFEAIRQQQEASELEDYRIGKIAEYLSRSNDQFTCCVDIWENALHINPDRRQMTRTEANEIGEILRHKLGCNLAGKKRFGQYGVQHAYAVPDSLKMAFKQAE